MLVEQLGAILLRSPSPLLGLLARRREADGQVLDTQLSALVGLWAKAGLPETHELTVAEARAAFAGNAGLLAPRGRKLASVEDRCIAGPGGPLNLRIYRPRGALPPAPALVFFHGGGWVIGDLDTHDRVCRAFAADVECVVVAVDYRLAPEHVFPAAAEDALAAFRWVRDNAADLGLDPARIAVGGDSAGGTLTAVTCQQVRDAGEPPPAFQLMIYPATDLSQEMRSYELFATGYLLPVATVRWFIDHYVPNPEDRKDPRCSPLLAEDLSGLPPALVQTAGFDPLRDEGEAYARALAAAGGQASYKRYPGLTHAFASLAGVVRGAREPWRDAVGALRTALKVR